MIVVVEKELEYVKDYLESQGKYEVKLNSDYVGPMDAYIFAETKEIENFSSFENNIADMRWDAADMDVKAGVLIINGAHKSLEEIEKILDDNLLIYMWE